MDKALALFEQGSYSKCLLLLRALRAGSPSPETDHLLLVCQIHNNAAAERWDKVLALGENASPSDIMKQFRKLASKVHPDKCSGPGAEEAFKLLGKAAAVLSSAIRQADGQPSEAAGSGDWWSEWDVAAEHESTKRKRADSSTEPTQQEQEGGGLDQLTIEELRAEVTRRQRAVLSPDAVLDEGLTVVERQRRLRAARALLSERMNAPAAEFRPGYTADAASGGGFLR